MGERALTKFPLSPKPRLQCLVHVWQFGECRGVGISGRRSALGAQVNGAKSRPK